MITFSPNEDRVLIDLSVVPDITKGGLHIPSDAKSKPSTGRVVAVGPGVCCRHCGAQNNIMPEVGMFVVFPESAGSSLMIDDKEYRIIRSSDIHGHDPAMFESKELSRKEVEAMLE